VHQAAAKAVFAHYMVGTVRQEHAQKDIDDAKALGFDGFALNIGDATQDFVSSTLSYMFPYAESVGFKLYVSMDVLLTTNGSGMGYKASSAYYQVEGKTLISTFSSGGFHDTNWTKWKTGLADDMFFMPDFDETDGYYKAADAWWDYWRDIFDGIFSWETDWPARKGYGGLTAGDVCVDVLPMKGAHNRSKPYMMARTGLKSILTQVKYGTNVYRQGDLNLVKRMQIILQMDPQPDYVQFITWNDGPKSHYIGNLWVEQNNDTQPWFYANQEFWPHKAWQPLVASFIDAYKNGKKPTEMAPQSGQVVGAMWCKTILVDSVDCGYESAVQFDEKPDGLDNGADDVWWSIILSPDAGTGWKYLVSGEEDHENALSPGFNWGSSAGKVAGAQRLQVLNPSGDVVMSATGGLYVDTGCPNLIYNSNYQVIGL
ncbi:putative glucan endo-1,3-alpha-glucosidase agn1, partial [Aspergillus ellipticus CBS 707.79]